jgi:hypothetical protein
VLVLFWIPSGKNEAMKKLVLLLALIPFELMAVSYTKQVVKKTTHAVKKAGKTVGNEAAEIAVKGESKVTDEEVKGKVAPNGRKVYVKDGNKYYWVDEKGGKNYIQASEMMSK